jgi:FkbM family methyltransferase
VKKIKVVTRSEWYLPDYDEHFSEQIDNGMYQSKQRRFALGSVRRYNIALDIGSNIGFWSKPLCDQFKTVVAFEPDKQNNECFKKNLRNLNNWQLEEIALSDKNGYADLYSDGENCGDLSFEHNDKKYKHTVETKKLDDYINRFATNTVDFIKIDTQDHEYKILKGGLKFLKNHEAVLCIEMPRRSEKELENAEKIKKLLGTIGYYLEVFQKKESIFVRKAEKK